MTTDQSHSIIWNTFKITGISLIQVSIFIALYEAVVESYVSNFGPMNKLFGFEMQIDNGTYLLSILAGINSLGQSCLEKLEVRLITALLCTAVWIAYWGNISDEVPNRFLLLSVLGMLSFSSGVLLSFRGEEIHYI